MDVYLKGKSVSPKKKKKKRKKEGKSVLASAKLL
jgi:hypothetical protein